jgi:hypothetical protein
MTSTSTFASEASIASLMMTTLSTFASAMSTRVRRRFLCRYRFLLLT